MRKAASQELLILQQACPFHPINPAQATLRVDPGLHIF
jgi:hypothetical protein